MKEVTGPNSWNDNLPLLDVDGALSHVQGDKSFLHEIYQIFVDEIPERLESFRLALGEEDVQKIIRLAHSLKGVSLTIGAVSCSTLAGKLEAAGRAEDWTGVVEFYSLLEKVLLDLDRELSNILTENRFSEELDRM